MRSSGPQKPPIFDSAQRVVAGPFPQITKRPVVGPAVPLKGPFKNSKGDSGESGSRSFVRYGYKIRAASEAPPRKSRSQSGGILYSSVLPVVRSIFRMGCIIYFVLSGAAVRWGRSRRTVL